MSWRDLLEKESESIVLPYTGGSTVHAYNRHWKLKRKPRDHGWYKFSVSGRVAQSYEPAEPDVDKLYGVVTGFLVGNRLVATDSRVNPSIEDIIEHTEPVYLIDPGLDRFTLVRAGRPYPEGPLIYMMQEFPPEGVDEVMDAFLDKKTNLHGIPGVSPGLHCAFLMETWYRDEAEKRRLELERVRREEEERLAQERRREELRRLTGTGEARRELAKLDFEAAARAALAVSGAELLDWRKDARDNYVVKYRCEGHRLECICDDTLHIIDAGVCLDDHRGTKGDTFFTLESLPAVIKEAIDLDVLVIWRHG